MMSVTTTVLAAAMFLAVAYGSNETLPHQKILAGLSDYYKLFEADPVFMYADPVWTKKLSKKYKKLAVKVHPDKNAHKDTEGVFILLKDAYDTMLDDRRRWQYDALRQRRRVPEEVRSAQAAEAVRRRARDAEEARRAQAAEEVRVAREAEIKANARLRESVIAAEQARLAREEARRAREAEIAAREAREAEIEAENARTESWWTGGPLGPETTSANAAIEEAWLKVMRSFSGLPRWKMKRHIRKHDEQNLKRDSDDIVYVRASRRTVSGGYITVPYLVRFVYSEAARSYAEGHRIGFQEPLVDVILYKSWRDWIRRRGYRWSKNLTRMVKNKYGRFVKEM